ncbi:hypothetical protein GGI25_001472 [Coemansia spiralis]|uniref:RFX-type winged-helix domain-containing protein n=1 Tax=Coemansia spiralis TaxID=417178 RepID=A0A9W8KYG8_9FUNG|nr:hypothetical protein GGI25_001472 [Coemansia spiralis]
MQANSPALYRQQHPQQQQQQQRLASINNYQFRQKTQHQPSTPTMQRARLPAASPLGANGTVNGNSSAKPASTQPKPQTESRSQQAFINEEFMTYLLGGPFNRFALALKSNLDNEIDWACARLVPATSYAPDSWSLAHYAPFLVEAILGVLEKSRKVLVNASFRPNKAATASGIVKANVRKVVLSNTGLEMVAERASERAGLLATALFNIAQIGENAAVMAQDPRITIEATHWLRVFHSDNMGYTRIKTDFLDLLDILLPLTQQPPFDSMPLRKWPVFGSQESSALDPLALVETCLWAELVRVLQGSQERKLVLGALRLLAQSISWHPQLAREILDLPVPRWAVGTSFEFVGELINARLAELMLAPDPELVSGCFELILNTVRLEAMAKALDEELENFAIKAAEAAAERGGSSSIVKTINEKRRRRLRTGYDTPDMFSGADSGSQTPIFGFRPGSRALGPSANDIAVQSEASMLPDGLTALVALVMQQWMSAACPPPQQHAPMLNAASLKNGSMVNGTQPRGASISANNPNGQQNQDQQQSAANKQPTEPELREACTWVLLNYEFAAPVAGQQQSTSYVTLADLFGRYMIAKHGQTVPRIGRALTLSEMVRVVAAVFPKASIQAIGQQQQQRQAGQQTSSDSLVALYLRPKTQNIVPIPAVPVDNQQKPQDAAIQSVELESEQNCCQWLGCNEKLTSEEHALKHMSEHISAADACRWRSCNRIPAKDSESSAAKTRQWLSRHVLIHGPFFKQPESAEQSGKPPTEASKSTVVANPDLFLLAQRIREEKTSALSSISPLFSGGHVPQSDQKAQQQVLRLVLQGIGVVEQLQKWADRRAGSRGIQDRRKIWRCADDVLERVAFIAAQSTVVAPYASRLLAILNTPFS